MATQRFQTVIKYEDRYFSPNCPVCLSSYAVLYDHKEKKYIAQLKLKNCSNKTIDNVRLKIRAFNQDGELTEELDNCEYIGLNASGGNEFGSKSLKPLSGNVPVKQFQILMNKVVFNDGQEWTSDEGELIETKIDIEPLSTVLSDEEIETYKSLTNPKMQYVPYDCAPSWICSCGELNYDSSTCFACGCEKIKVFEFVEKKYLHDAILKNKYDHALRNKQSETITALHQAITQFEELGDYQDSRELLEDCRRKLISIQKAEEDKKREEERQAEIQRKEAEEKAKKNKRIVMMAAAIAVICIAGYLLMTYVIIPNNKYNAALALMKSGEYEAAIESFEALNAYRDSEEKIEECQDGIMMNKYNAAITLMDSAEYDKAIEAFEALNGYKDSDEKIKECEDAILLENYNEALALIDSGDYEEAIEKFLYLKRKGYKDSEKKIEECKTNIYNDAKHLMDKGDYENGLSKLKSLGNFKDSIELINNYYIENYGVDEKTYNQAKDLKVGDIFAFGKYEQDGDSSDGKEPLQWIVLARENDDILLTSRYAIDCMQFNDSYGEVTWETSSIRNWLNGSFIDTAFTSGEAGKIKTTTVTADPNPKSDINQGNDTKDKVFLFSIDEMKKYFSSDENRACFATMYAGRQGADVYPSGNCRYWLRTIGKEDQYKSKTYYLISIMAGTSFAYDQYGSTYKGICVRPAMWINLNNK